LRGSRHVHYGVFPHTEARIIVAIVSVPNIPNKPNMSLGLV
jgi:hypothetical protein